MQITEKPQKPNGSGGNHEATAAADGDIEAAAVGKNSNGSDKDRQEEEEQQAQQEQQEPPSAIANVDVALIELDEDSAAAAKTGAAASAADSAAAVPPRSAISAMMSESSVLALTPTSPRSITTTSMSASDDLVEHENETLRDRVSDLEKRVHDQNDEITCLRATLADALRRINTLESGKEHVQINHVISRGTRDSPGPPRTPLGRRHPGHHDPVGRRASYASNREKLAHAAVSRRSMAAAGLYQSTGSLHSDSHSSNNSMSPTASPSPTLRPAGTAATAVTGTGAATATTTTTTPGRSSTAPIRSSGGRAIVMMGPPRPPPPTPPTGTPTRSHLSGSMSNLSLSGSKKWNSTSDFHSPAASGVMSRCINAGSLRSLRSPFGSQQNLADRTLFRHGTKDATFNEEEGYLRMFVRGRPLNLFAPSALGADYSLEKVVPAPAQRPKLEWVYGYRGRDARSNLYLLPTGEMVYFVAAVVVLFNAEEHSQRHYLGHTGDIKCLSVHPNKLVIATGQTNGRDRGGTKVCLATNSTQPHIRIWNSVSLQTLHVLGMAEFDRAVVCLSFSKADGGNLLVAVSEDHTMSVWDWSRGERGSKVTETKCSSETVVAAEFHPLEAGIIVAIGRGHANFWQLDSTALTLSRKTGLFDQRDKPKYVTCLAFSYTGDVLTGDSNGHVFVWGRGYNAVTKALRKVHDGPIFSICVLKDGSIITGGGKDRRLVQFDSAYKRTGMEAELPEHLGSVRTISQGRGSQLLLGSTRNSILQGTFELGFQEIVTGHVDEVWALSAHPQQSHFLSAGYDMHIHLWDTLSHRAIWSSNLGDQAQSACFSSTGEIIVVGMASGKWMVLDSSTREVYGVFTDGHEPIQVLRFSPDDRLLALGSRDSIIYIYHVSDNCKKFNRMGRCSGHSSFVAHLDWSKDSTYIRSNSGDSELLFWNASICRKVNDVSSMRDVDWVTQTCVISFHTVGVWPETDDGASEDVNACARSHQRKILVTGDNNGKIKVYANPAVQPKSLHHGVSGHSCTVTRLDFLPDDSRFISAGGRDTAIMQWALIAD